VLNQQDVFTGSLWENIALGNENADSTYISRLTEITGLSEFISTLPKGFDTILDATGNRLPKNVVQKIMLVRALAHKPKLLLLEEPWQGIGDQAAKQIQDFLLTEVDATVMVATNDPHFIRQSHQSITL
jgi:ABC-type bacteriocin/lantibiotic exporter with double-glycine peptidase domain